jgi:TatD DNase family protein
MNYFIDTHAHIYADDFDGDRPDVIARCVENNVLKIIMPNVDHTSVDAMLEAESRFSNVCVATMGLHPCSVKKGFERELYLVEEWLAKRKFSAVGEIGTDLYWDKTFWNYQQEAFSVQMGWAKQYKIPIIIHCRESLDETIEMVESARDENLRGIFHCFSGSIEQARKVIGMGFYLGIGGVVTFKKGGLEKVLQEIELKHLVLETDSPYLAPVPHRGKRNEPTYIPLIAEKIAALKDISVEEVRSTTTQNAISIFGIQDVVIK